MKKFKIWSKMINFLSNFEFRFKLQIFYQQQMSKLNCFLSEKTQKYIQKDRKKHDECILGLGHLFSAPEQTLK